MAYTATQDYLEGLNAKPLAPEFDPNQTLKLAIDQIQGRLQSPRLMQLLGRSGATGGQVTNAYLQNEGGLAKGLASAGLNAGIQEASAKAGERRFREGLGFQAASQETQIRETRRARGLQILQSLLSTATRLPFDILNQNRAARTERDTIGIAGATALGNLGLAFGQNNQQIPPELLQMLKQLLAQYQTQPVSPAQVQ